MMEGNRGEETRQCRGGWERRAKLYVGKDQDSMVQSIAITLTQSKRRMDIRLAYLLPPVCK